MRSSRFVGLVWLVGAPALIVCSCWRSQQTGSGSQGVDTAGDSDVDVDSDTDVDGDSDTDADSDSDGDTDTGTGFDAAPGELLWAVSAGGNGVDQPFDVAAVAGASSVVVGSIGAGATFGDGEDGESYVPVEGFGDGFVARFAASGELIWARGIGGVGIDHALGVAGVAGGASVVVGDFDGSAVVGSGDSGGVTIESTGGADGYLARYDADGVVGWIAAVGGEGEDTVSAVGTGADGVVRVVGTFEGTTVLEGGDAADIELSSEGSDAFVAGYDADGTLAWGRVVQAVVAADYGPFVAYDVGGFDVAVAVDGAALVVGPWGCPAVFAPDEPDEVALDTGMLVAGKYSAGGDLAWALADGDLNNPYYDTGFGSGIVPSPSGGAWIAGQWKVIDGDEIVFGLDADQVVLIGQGGAEVFVARYGASAELSWVVRAGGEGEDAATDIAALGDDAVVVVGRHGTEAVFGEEEAGETLLTTDMLTQKRAFVARYDGDGSLVWATSAGGGVNTGASAVAVAGDGAILVTGYFSGTAVFGEGEAHETTLHAAAQRDVFLAKYAP